jgi:raffinose/stachyose/melibiose transport system substrate-binding protein
VRWAWEKLLDGAPDGYTLMQDNSIAVLNGEMTAQEAADALQAGLAQWFEPAQNCAP